MLDIPACGCLVGVLSCDLVLCAWLRSTASMGEGGVSSTPCR